MSEKPCILIADDDPDTRKIWSDSLTYWGADVLDAADGDEALRLAKANPIDLALLDVMMPGPSGIDLSIHLQRIAPNVKVIVITAYASVDQAVDAMRQGAYSYLAKPCTPGQVRQVVARAWAEQQCETRERIGELVIDWRQGEVTAIDATARFCDLSQREQHVLDELVTGKTDEEIAHTLDIRTSTVRTHLRNIMRKFGLKNRGQAILLWDRYKHRQRK